MAEDFTWLDGERLVRFGEGASREAGRLLVERGFDGYALLTTERALTALPALAEGADAVVRVPTGKVDELSAALLEDAGRRPLVALGGGRVVDVAKAVAGAGGAACAAIPTTLAGSPMTRFHRTPAGVEGAGLVRPSLVVADPPLMASQPGPQRAASAMNALAHAMESLY
ncbi:MAG: iron-containing alcohol dehydrogenase, partial [Thermoleophilaceae bacterium]